MKPFQILALFLLLCCFMKGELKYSSSPTEIKKKMGKTYLILSTLLLTIAYSNYANAKYIRQELDMAVLLPNDTLDGECIRHAIEMGFEDVNSKNGFITLNDTYEFKLVPHTAVVDEEPGNAVEALYNLYHSKDYPRIFGTIGPPHRDQNELCIEYSTVATNLHISYSEVNEPIQFYFAFFFPSIPSIVFRFDAARRLTDKYGWKRVGILYDYSAKQYRKNADNLRAALIRKNDINETVEVIADYGIWSYPPEYVVSKEVSSLQTQGARIIMALVSVGGARKIFCEAYHRQMYSPKVTWILFETLPFDWASTKYDASVDKDTGKPVREIDCNEEELLTASSGYISITKQKIRRDGKRTISNMTAEEFLERLNKRLADDVKCPDHTAYAYDAVWTEAVAYKQFFLNHVNTTWNFTHNDFQHFFSFGLEVRDYVRIMKYEGLTGSISYLSRDGFIFNRVGQLSIYSNKKHQNPIFVGTDDTSSESLSMIPNETHILFQENKIPVDEAIYVKTFSHFEKPLLISMWTVSCIGIVLALLFLLVTITFVIDKNIVMQSPGIHCVIILGSVLCYTSVIIYGLDTRFTPKEDTHYVCWAFLFTLSTGFTLTFGSLFAKTWQLYKLYMTPEVKVSNNQIQMKNVPEWSLFLIIGIFLFVDAIILCTWIIFSPFENETRNITKQENLFADTIEIEQIVGCWCKYETEFTIGMYCYKGVILIFGIFLAWQTRNGAKIKIQNESKQIAMAIYNVVAVSVIGVICVSVLTNTTRHHATYAIVAVCISICTTTTLLLVFCPKIRKIINSEGLSLNSSKSDTTTSVDHPYEEKYKIAYNRKDNDKDGGTKPTLSSSTGTVSTQMSTEQTQQTNCGSMEGNSVVSGNASYLSNSMFMTPPSYAISEEPRKRVDSMGRLSSGIYVGAIQEEPENIATQSDVQKDENQL